MCIRKKDFSVLIPHSKYFFHLALTHVNLLDEIIINYNSDSKITQFVNRTALTIDYQLEKCRSLGVVINYKEKDFYALFNSIFEG